MPNTFFGLTIGKSGLYTYQAALNTTAHNSSNVDTEGYSKQVANRTASQAISMVGAYGMQGSGVDVTSITQLRNIYYDEKYWENSQVFGNYNTKTYYIQAIENYFSEVNAEGTTAAFDDAFTALNGLQSTPGDITYRTQVTEGFKSFTDYVQSLYAGLQSIQEEANDEIKNSAHRINSIAEQIATLNKQINTIEIQDMKANDLRDARALLIDELSQYANISVTEKVVGDGVGITQYIVQMDSKILVDTYNYNTLIAKAKDNSVNQCDVNGLYELTWSDGQAFNNTSPSLGGKLQALYEVRDGNNKDNFTGTVNGTKGSKELVLTGSNVNDINYLNIPDSDGAITIGSSEYTYTSFEVAVDADGNYTYTFQLEKALQRDVTDRDAEIGKSLDYKGVPYYMSRLNEFVRTFSAEFNNVHKSGVDFNADDGKDFFTAIADTENVNYSFQTTETGFSSLLATDEEGNLVKTDGYAAASYYHMTAGNFTVNMDILDDPKKLACASNILSNGVDEGDIAKRLCELKTNVNMFKQGTPGSFLQTFTGELGIDGKEAENFTTNQKNILEAVELQRMSISGVDSDEEAMDLVKFKNAYDLCSQVVSVMNQIYNKLINETGV